MTLDDDELAHAEAELQAAQGIKPNCTGKEAFPTFEAAQQGIRPHMGNRVRAYRCTTCGKWHIGNHTKIKTTKNRYLRGNRK